MSVHTRIDQPITMRRDLLECAIDCAEVLRSIENVKRIHNERELVKKKLKVVMDKLRIVNSRFSKELPALPREKKEAVDVEEPKPKVQEVKAPRPKVPRGLSEEEKINRDLDSIRKKIEAL